ncbi:MAG TPA: M48 family metallopeptidase [Flavobacteriaceae bacterium]|nr:M48 family metallopeptidase [Flavobacteriaceae bacterium]
MTIKTISYGIVMAAITLGCATNPFTGEKTLSLVPNSTLFPMAFQQYNQFLSENKVISGTAEAAMVDRVGRNIATAAEKYLRANGYGDYLKEYRWEYKLVQSPEVNAWCMPGGKIVVYSGIMPIAKDEAGLAAIMGHEVAHALANHGQQRMSAGQLQQLGAVAGNLALAKHPENQQIFNTAYGLGTNLGVMLPFSRSHESEADKIGLLLMAIAGYEPMAAAELWQRMQAQEKGTPPEFLSTHPSSTTRINNITSWVPAVKQEAAKYGTTTFKR